jgi:hypothetical protein
MRAAKYFTGNFIQLKPGFAEKEPNGNDTTYIFFSKGYGLSGLDLSKYYAMSANAKERSISAAAHQIKELKESEGILIINSQHNQTHNITSPRPL